jgi:beta propeller repeat protein
MKLKIIILLLLIFTTISCASANSETKIATNQRLVQNTEIGANYVTWYETSANAPHVYNTVTNKIMNVPVLDSPVSSPMKVYNNKVVYCNDENVVLYDCDTRSSEFIATGLDWYGDEETNKGRDSIYAYPDIYGDKVVYQRVTDGVVHLELYDINTKEKSFVTDKFEYDLTPSIYGNKVAFVTGDRSRLYICDTKSKATTKLNTTGSVSDPDVDNGVVVWSSYVNGKNNVFMRDTKVSKTTQITTDGISTNPRISGNRIVYVKSTSKNSDIYMYNINTQETSRITTSGCAWAPSIYDNKVVYADSRSVGYYNYEDGEIYMCTLGGTMKPVAAFKAGYTSKYRTIQFSYTGTGSYPMTYKWDFGDGITSSGAIVTHTYKKVGSYTVKVTATNSAGSSTAIKYNYISVK